MKKNLNSENMTLVEILASIILFALIFGIGWIFLFLTY